MTNLIYVCCIRNKPEDRVDVFLNKDDHWIRLRQTKFKNPEDTQPIVKYLSLSPAEWMDLKTAIDITANK